jgi:SAM-dependent methyltransferase
VNLNASPEPDARTDVAAVRAFFGPRAATWEKRFPDDGPSYARAVAEVRLPNGATVLDAGCGTGRALPPLRAAVGPSGRVIGIDLTEEMIAEAARRGRGDQGTLLIGDVARLPLATASLDGVFAAGLLTHLDDPADGLAELARVTRPGGRLALFHPVGREALARRQGRVLTPEDVRAEPNIRAALSAAGWRCESVDDGPDRYLVLADH